MRLYHIERAQGVSVSWQAVQLNQITKQPTTEFKSINSREYFLIGKQTMTQDFLIISL